MPTKRCGVNLNGRVDGSNKFGDRSKRPLFAYPLVSFWQL